MAGLRCADPVGVPEGGRIEPQINRSLARLGHVLLNLLEVADADASYKANPTGADHAHRALMKRTPVCQRHGRALPLPEAVGVPDAA